MLRTMTIEMRRPAREDDIFFKCPNGGFASLRPGICPKCHESLTVVKSRDSAHESSERRTVVSESDQAKAK